MYMTLENIVDLHFFFTSVLKGGFFYMEIYAHSARPEGVALLMLWTNNFAPRLYMASVSVKCYRI
jgi:hypothetical protein